MYLDYLGRTITVGDTVCMLNPMRTRTVEALLPDGTLIASTPEGERVRVTRSRACILHASA